MAVIYTHNISLFHHNHYELELLNEEKGPRNEYTIDIVNGFRRSGRPKKVRMDCVKEKYREREYEPKYLDKFFFLLRNVTDEK